VSTNVLGRRLVKEADWATLIDHVNHLADALDQIQAWITIGLTTKTDRGVMAHLLELRTTVERLTQTLHGPTPAAGQPAPTVAALVLTLSQQVTHLASHVQTLSQTLGQHQGTLAATEGDVATLTHRLTGLERQQQAALQQLTQLVQAQQETRDALTHLLAQHEPQLTSADAFSLLVRLLRELPPLFRHGELICYEPRAATDWLLGQGVARREIDGVRRAWRDSGLVPAESPANFNKRIRLRDGAQPYFVAVPATTFADLRVPVPRGLANAPPARSRPGSAPTAA
jgi:hypothetical protein